MILGKTRENDHFKLGIAQRQTSHTHIIGKTRTGKSKMMENMIRQDVDSRQALCLIDWHGTTYNDLLAWLAYAPPSQQVYLFNPSQPDFVSGFNPFLERGPDIPTTVSRKISAVLRPWGVDDPNQMPTFERLARLLFTFAAEQGEPLTSLDGLLQFDEKPLREYAAKNTSDPYLAKQWLELNTLNRRDFRSDVLSTQNRLNLFLAMTGVRRFVGLKTGNFEVGSLLDGDPFEPGKILLVNLAQSDYLDRRSASLFAALLVQQFFDAAMRRSGAKRLFFLYLDEFQNYLSRDMADSLDQAMKGGLHLTMAHQHMTQLGDQRLRDSVLVNARNRFVFGGLDSESAKIMAEEMYLNRINQRQIKNIYTIKSVDDYELREFDDTTTTYGTTTGSSDGELGSRSSDSVHEGTSTRKSRMLIPKLKERELPPPEWTLQDKISKVAELLIDQKQRHCVARLDTERPVLLETSNVRTFYTDPKDIEKYVRKLYEAQGAITAEEADRQIEEARQAFIERVTRKGPNDFETQKKAKRSV